MDLSSRNALAAATLAVLAFSASALAADIKQSGEQKDMKLVGHVDLQGRGAYQPNFIKYPDGRIIAFAGLHPSPNLNGVPAGAVKNPLNGNVAEPNGTMIIDRKSTRLNSSHRCISYAVFCLKKKMKRNLFFGLQERPDYTSIAITVV